MAMEKTRPSYALGIDIGTTTVKVAVVEADTRRLVHSASRETKASVPSELGPLGNEQDAHKICTALQWCVSRAPREHLQRVNRIAVSGQMHGLVLWKQDGGWTRNQFGRYETGEVSTLVTWQDGRCSTEFLASLPPTESPFALGSGHGCASLFWFQKHRPDIIQRYDRAGTIQDYMVAMVCGLDHPVMSIQNAASWGYYSVKDNAWETDRLEKANFPVHLLPDVKAPGHVAGTLPDPWYGIQAGAEVGVALGDMQCSVYSTLENDTDAVLNISTSAQLSFIMPENFCPPPVDFDSSIQYFPYFQDRYLAVAASLNGGNVLATFVRTLQQWTHELGLGVPEDKIWEKILSLAMEENSAKSDLVIVPTLFGERHLPNQRASVSHIDTLNITLGKVARSLCRGVIANLHDMMSRDALLEGGVQRIVGSGSALTRNAVLREELKSHYDLPVVFGAGSDAALGVALAMLDFAERRMTFIAYRNGQQQILT